MDSEAEGGAKCTNNAKALLVVSFLFGLIATVQLIAAVTASSDALLVDGLSMLVDTATYLGNLLTEFCGGGAGSELLASGASLAVLYAVAMYGIVSAAMELGDPIGAEERPLSPWIVFAFGLWGLGFDFLSFWGFHRWGLEKLVAGAEPDEDDPRQALATLPDQPVPSPQPMDTPTSACALDPYMASSQAPVAPDNKPPEVSMNMKSAMMHVGADFLRSAATVIEGALVIFGGQHGRTVDALATMAVSATIVAGGCGAGASWIREAWKMRYARRRRKKGLPVGIIDGFPTADVIGMPSAASVEPPTTVPPRRKRRKKSGREQLAAATPPVQAEGLPADEEAPAEKPSLPAIIERVCEETTAARSAGDSAAEAEAVLQTWAALHSEAA